MVDPEGFYKVLKKDPLFAHFQKIVSGKAMPITLEDLQEAVRGIGLNNAVPAQVREVLEIAKQLYILGYFNYRLFTVSSHYGFLAIEAALTNKYKEIYGKDESSLDRIIRKLAEDNLIIAEKKEIYDSCRHLRNELSHLATQKVLSPDAVLLYRAAELINDLYK